MKRSSRGTLTTAAAWAGLSFVLGILFTSPVHGQTVRVTGATPIGVETFHQRRLALLDSLKDGAAVLYSSRREEASTGYRADGSFWYLTGNDDPGAILLLLPGDPEDEILLLRPRDIEAERWTGDRPALTESLQTAWGFDRIRRVDYLDWLILRRMKHEHVLHLISSLAAPSDPVPPDLELYGKVSARIPGVEIKNSSRLLERMRVIKSDAEIAAIEKAIAVTHQGITDVLAAVRPGVTEFGLDGIFEESLKRRGAQHMAFEPIVGAGEETTVLHYEKQDQTLAAGQLLLLDVGAEWDHYCADISRTFPVDSAFSPEQAGIYDVVVAAQDAAIAAVKPGATMRDVNEAARAVVRRAGYTDALIHDISHHLGLEVHDGSGDGVSLEPGMVITVEPGLYFRDKAIGVRLEDDVLVTATGNRLLSAAIPRDRAAVEAWLAAARK